jgi:predicted nucleic acid-binding protein
VTYLDASAILRVIMPHAWTPALVAFLVGRGQLGTSVIAVVETRRGLMRDRAPEDQVATAEKLLSELLKVAVTSDVIRTASTIPRPTLRALDALHVASAIEAGATVLVTYDRNMATAARSVGLKVASPGLN